MILIVKNGGGQTARKLSCEEIETQISLDIEIYPPEKLQEKLADIRPEDIVILVPVISLKAQDEILKMIQKLYSEKVNVYTDYAIQWGIYLNINNPCIAEEYREKKLTSRKQKMEKLKSNPHLDIRMSARRERELRYFALLPVHNDEIILVYQPGKVGSSSVYRSIEAYGKNVLHCHNLTYIGENEDDLYKILDLKTGKMICLIRDPVARAISAMWENLALGVHHHSIDTDFSEYDQSCLRAIYEKHEFAWFDAQMKKVFGIDVFHYPFNREDGYVIIKEENIELLLIKMEKLNGLEDVIGDFLNISDFHLKKANIGAEKAYRFAYQEYKNNFRVPKEILRDVYQDDECMKHFYTEQERKEFYEKWVRGEDEV